MPSKFASTVSISPASENTGWVEDNWSCAYAHAFSLLLNVTHAVSYFVAPAWLMAADQVAKDSFSHRSSHHFMVTRSPNHMCANS